MILAVMYGLYERVIKKNGDNIYALSVHPGAVCPVVLACVLTIFLPKFGFLIMSCYADSVNIGKYGNTKAIEKHLSKIV